MAARDCIARSVTMPFEALAPLRAEETLALAQSALELEPSIAAECEASSAELYRLAGGHEGARDPLRRNALLALRRAVFHARIPPDVARTPGVTPALGARLERLALRIGEQQRLAIQLRAAFERDRERADRALAELTRAPLFEEALRLVS